MSLRRLVRPAWDPVRYKVPPAISVPERIVRPSYADHPKGLPRGGDLPFGERKGTAAVYGMRSACQLAAEALAVAALSAKEGVTTDEVDRVASRFVVSRGGYPVGINYHGFPRGLCASVNEVAVHGVPNTRPLESGDIVNLDVSVFRDGFYGDCSKMVCVGEVDDQARALVDATEGCLYHAIDNVGPGMPLSHVGKVCSDYARQRGYGIVREYCGHFIGSELHMRPTVLHVRNENHLELEPGMTFTIEPILTEGDAALQKPCEDGWTILTEDGGWAAQWEHTVLVTEEGLEILTKL